MPDSDAIFERMLRETFTVTDFYKRLLLLQDLLEHSVYAARGAPSGDALRAQYLGDDQQAADAIAAWGDDVLHFFSSGDLHANFETIKKRVQESPILILYIPSTVSAAHVASLGSWCRERIQKNLLLDIRIDRAAAGGCMIVWQNALHDFSFPYFLSKHKPEVAALLSNEQTRAANV